MDLAQKVKASLFEVIDPELGVNIMDLGLIYEIIVEEQHTITINMTLTTPGCPMSESIRNGVIFKIQQIAEVREVKVRLVFDPPWTPDKMSERCKDLLWR